MIAGLKKIVDKALARGIVKLIYKPNDIALVKFFTTNEKFINKKLNNNPINFEAFNYVTEKVETVYYGHLISYELETEDNVYSSNEYTVLPKHVAHINKSYFSLIKKLLLPPEVEFLENVFQDQTQIDYLEMIYKMFILIEKSVLSSDRKHITREQLELFADKKIDTPTKKLMWILDIFDSEQLKDLNFCKKQMMKLIKWHVEKEKKNIDLEFESYKKEDNSIPDDEIVAIKEFLDQVADDYSIFTDQEIPYDLIYYCWPPILAPNPFVAFLNNES